MKLLFTLASLLASSTLVFAQATATATATATTKPKPLSSADKSFVKNSTESIYYLTNLADKVKAVARDGNVSEGTKTLSTKVGGELGKVWGEIGAISTAAGETLPAALKGADKTKVAGLGKLKDEKFEKEYAELSAKELKRLVSVMESGSKNTQNTELKAIAEKWTATVKGISDDAATLSKTVGKK